MKQTKLYTLFLFTLLFCTGVFAQNLSWNSIAKIPGNKHDYYLGKSGDYYYSLFSNMFFEEDPSLRTSFTGGFGFTITDDDITLAKFDTGFHLISATQIKHSKKINQVLAAFITDQGLTLAYMGKDKTKPFYADKFSMDGAFLKTETLRENGEGLTFRHSPDGKNFILIEEDKLSILDNNLNAVSHVKLPSKKFREVKINNAGEIYGLCEYEQKEVFIPFYYNPKKQTLLVNDMSVKHKNEDGKNAMMDFYTGIHNNKMYVIGLAGASFKARLEHNNNSVRGIDPFSAIGYEVNEYDLSNMRRVGTVSAEFPQEYIDKSNIQKGSSVAPIGFDGLKVENTFLNKKGELIIVTQMNVLIQISRTDPDKRTTTTYYKYYSGNMLLMRLDSSLKKINDQFIERRIDKDVDMQPVTALITMWNNDKLYLMFNNDENPDKGFVRYVFDQNLGNVSDNAISAIDEGKINLGTTGCYPIGGNRFVIFGRHKKDVGTATISF